MKGANLFYRITLKRSFIGLPEDRKQGIRILGLRRLQQVVFHAATPDIAGALFRYKEMLQVQLISGEVMQKELSLLSVPKKDPYKVVDSWTNRFKTQKMEASS